MGRFARRAMFTAGSATPSNPVRTAVNLTLDTHQAYVDGSNKLVSWVSDQSLAYAHVSQLSWEYIIGRPNESNGKPAYYSHSYQDPNTQQPVGWPHNPAGLYAMFVESGLRYYQFTGDQRVMNIAKAVVDHHLANGMTAPGDSWSSVPYASADAGSLTYDGASYGDTTGAGDGTGILEPDKIAELGLAIVQLYKYTETPSYLTSAIQCADQLVAHVRAGNASQSPWPYRVKASNNVIKEQYCSHLDSAFDLFDELIALNAGTVANYQTTKTNVWNWMMTYPMQNNVWQGYFEDVPYNVAGNNLNQLNAMMMARYLLKHPELDVSWETHVRGLIGWVETNFAIDPPQYGAIQIREQEAFHYRMASHTSRYASINALLYEKTGDTAAKEKAYRSFNWATYMARSNGVVIDGPEVNNQWFTDGYGDFVRHFMVGMGAVPAWAPTGQTHIVYTSSVVQTVNYPGSGNLVTYATFGNDGIERIRVSRAPIGVTVNGSPIAQRSDLAAQGWVYNASAKLLEIRRTGGDTVVVS